MVGTFTNGYLRVATRIGKEGANQADGARHRYSPEREIIHTMDANAFFVVIVTNGAEGLDKFSAAVDDLGKNNPTALAAFRSLKCEVAWWRLQFDRNSPWSVNAVEIHPKNHLVFGSA